MQYQQEKQNDQGQYFGSQFTPPLPLGIQFQQPQQEDLLLLNYSDYLNDPAAIEEQHTYQALFQHVEAVALSQACGGFLMAPGQDHQQESIALYNNTPPQVDNPPMEQQLQHAPPPIYQQTPPPPVDQQHLYNTPPMAQQHLYNKPPMEQQHLYNTPPIMDQQMQAFLSQSTYQPQFVPQPAIVPQFHPNALQSLYHPPPVHAPPDPQPAGDSRTSIYVRKACVCCKASHVACDVHRPCHRCVRLNKADECRDAERKKRGRPVGSGKKQQEAAAAAAIAAAAADMDMSSLVP